MICVACRVCSQQTYVSYFRRWHTEHGAEPVKPTEPATLVVEEKPQAPVVVPEPAPEPTPPSVASGKQHGLNDAHILAQVEKRFCKLRALQTEKLYVAPSPPLLLDSTDHLPCVSCVLRGVFYVSCVVCAVCAVCAVRAQGAGGKD